MVSVYFILDWDHLYWSQQILFWSLRSPLHLQICLDWKVQRSGPHKVGVKAPVRCHLPKPTTQSLTDSKPFKLKLQLILLKVQLGQFLSCNTDTLVELFSLRTHQVWSVASGFKLWSSTEGSWTFFFCLEHLNSIIGMVWKKINSLIILALRSFVELTPCFFN